MQSSFGKSLIIHTLIIQKACALVKQFDGHDCFLKNVMANKNLSKNITWYSLIVPQMSVLYIHIAAQYITCN